MMAHFEDLVDAAEWPRLEMAGQHLRRRARSARPTEVTGHLGRPSMLDAHRLHAELTRVDFAGRWGTLSMISSRPVVASDLRQWYASCALPGSLLSASVNEVRPAMSGATSGGINQNASASPAIDGDRRKPEREEVGRASDQPFIIK